MPRRHPAALTAMIGLAVAVAAACGADAPTVDLGGGCALASDCASPLICAYKRCHQQCDADRDCPSSERCVRTDTDGNVCQLAVEKDCDRTSDCPAGQVCAVDRECRNGCRDAKDCTPEQICTGGTCASKGEVGPGGKLPQKSGGDGTPCSYDSECEAPRVCENHQCVYPCVGDADCPLEARCTEHQCEALEPVCIPGQQRSCVPCGVKRCDDAGMWEACSNAGCGGGGQGGAGGASSSNGAGASTSHASGTHASSGAGGNTTSSTTTSSSGAGGMTSSSSATSVASSSHATTASSSVTTTSSSATAGGVGPGGGCMPCMHADAGIDGQGGAPNPRILCCP